MTIIGSSQQPIRLLLCDDQTLFRQCLCSLLRLERDLQVVGEASYGDEALWLAEQRQPDIVLMDLNMRGDVQNGINAIAAIKKRTLPCRVIILTTFEYEGQLLNAFQAGADDWLFKDASAAELVRKIRQVYAGEQSIPPELAAKLLLEYKQRRKLSPLDATDPDDVVGNELTLREVQVLRLLANGESNRIIGDWLGLTEGTVKNYVSKILTKLHAENRTQAANAARERRLI